MKKLIAMVIFIMYFSFSCKSHYNGCRLNYKIKVKKTSKALLNYSQKMGEFKEDHFIYFGVGKNLIRLCDEVSMFKRQEINECFLTALSQAKHKNIRLYLELAWDYSIKEHTRNNSDE